MGKSLRIATDCLRDAHLKAANAYPHDEKFVRELAKAKKGLQEALCALDACVSDEHPQNDDAIKVYYRPSEVRSDDCPTASRINSA